MGTCFYSSTRHSQAKCQKQDCLYNHVSFILSVVIRRTQHTPKHPKTPLHTPHSPMPRHPQVSVTQNQLESQCKSAHWSSLSSGANTFFRHRDTSLAQKSAPPPFSSWAPVSTALQDIHKPSVKSKTAYINMFPSFSLSSSGEHNTPQHTPKHPKTPQDTPHSPMPIHPQVSVTQNQLESQCKSAHWSSLSSGANTFFRHRDTSLAQKSAPPPFHHGHPFLQLYKTVTSQVSKQDCLYKHVSFIISVVIRRTQHTPTHPKTPLHTPHSPMPIHPQVSVTQNQLESQCKSAHWSSLSSGANTFFVIVTLHLRRSLHPPLFVMGTCFYSSTRLSQAKCQEQDCLYKHVSFIISVVIRRTQHTPTHPKTPLHTPHSPMPIHPQVSVTQNQLESQCKSAHWSSLSSGANTFFRHCDTSLAQKSAPPPFRHGHLFLQLYKTFTSQVSKARLPI